jgi:ZIP family zinc transporter
LAVFAAFLGGFIFHALLKALLRAPEAGGGLYLYLAPASLTFHSILDGAGIGIAFHLTSAAGMAAAAAVIAHDLADGINTVGVSLTRGTRQVAWRWLIANSAAPLIGFLSVSRINPVPTVLSLLLAAFAGFLLHIATREILPRVLGVNPLSIWIMAFLGFASLCAFKLLVPG